MLISRAAHDLDLYRISVDGVSFSIVGPRHVFKTASLSNAAALILAHQNPSGNPEPSRDDIQITRNIGEATEIMDNIYDHIIITESYHTSLAERGVIG